MSDNNNSHNCCCCLKYNFFFFINTLISHDGDIYRSIKQAKSVGIFLFSLFFLSHTHYHEGGLEKLFYPHFHVFLSSPFSSFYSSPSSLVRMKNLVDIESSKAKVLLYLFPSKKKVISYHHHSAHLESESFFSNRVILIFHECSSRRKVRYVHKRINHLQNSIECDCFTKEFSSIFSGKLNN